MIFLLMSFVCFAADLPGEEIFVAPVVNEIAKHNSSSEQEAPEPVKALRKKKAQPASESSNLPVAYLRPLFRESTASELVTPAKGTVELLRAIKVGDSIDAIVDHSVIAFTDEKAPVIASSSRGPFRGMKFIGHSYLEKNSRRIFLEFTRIALGQQVFEVKAVGLSGLGQPGLAGEYHSREAELFTGEFISSFVAGYFDGLVPRRTNAHGQIEVDTSVDSAVKKGLASGALSTAERFKEKLKRVPEFSEIRGPFQIQILILDQAKTNN